MAEAAAQGDQDFAPRILVFSTNNISDPGIDLAGSSHMHYSPNVMVINLPCTSAVKPSWILYAMEQGFDGVFIAADGEECAYLPDCGTRTAGIMTDAQSLLVEKGYEPQRVRMAAVCSVCAEPFTNYMHEYSSVPVGSGTVPEGDSMKYDALVVGSGIGGMESALKLGDMGYKVLVVEKDASVGGKMILLSKVFPTLDCASCISTPKMAATIHHPNIDVLTYAEVEGIRDNGDGTYHAKITQKPKFIDEAACTGCRQCEMACNVAVPDEFNADMVSRRAAYIAFPQAVPKKAVISRDGVSPCTYECPAGIKAHGYVARVRSGEYEEGFRPGARGDASRRQPRPRLLRALRGAVHARRARGSALHPPAQALHRRRALRPGGAEASEKPEHNGKKVAVVGSGPAGLTAAWQLARKGYGVKIFESAPQAGGMLRLGIPAYRLPNDVIDDDIANVTALGVEIATDARVDDVEALKNDGFDAVLVATGTHKSVSLRVPGEELGGVQTALDFLRAAKLGRERRPGRQARRGGRRRQRRHRRGALGPSHGRRLRRSGQPRALRGDAGPRFRGRRGPSRGHHAARRLGHRPLRGRRRRQARRDQGLHVCVRPRWPLPPRVRREPAGCTRLRRRHHRRRDGCRHRRVQPRDQRQPHAQD